MREVTIGSMCTGYGGLEMGLQQVIPHTRLAWYAEDDQAASRLLEIHHPGVPNLGDIKAVDWTSAERVDIVTAGIPCQPYSYAGQRGGENDERDLVGYFAEAVRILRPNFALVENVAGFKRDGLPRLCAEMAEMGFRTRWHSVRASDAGAPHRRERIFILFRSADAISDGQPWPWTSRTGGGRPPHNYC